MSENDTVSETKRKRAPSVRAKDFIRIYNSSESFDEVVEKTGLARHTVMQRASEYRRKHGINMRKFPQSATERNDWKELAEFAESVLTEVGYESPSEVKSEDDAESGDWTPTGVLD